MSILAQCETLVRLGQIGSNKHAGSLNIFHIV